MEYVRDHPDIESALRTGYPTWNQPGLETYYCEECGAPLHEDEVFEDGAHEYLCEECLCTLHQKW